jgi:3-deoxy-D-manno-octulosonate 8-phosphate phosphatase (KDO 8-P phosphatase)
MNQPDLTLVKDRLSQVKLLALDVDGVLTDGGLYYTDSGEETKCYNVKDGMGIKLVLEAGINVAIITNSTSKSVVYRAKKLNISHLYMGIEDKLSVLKNLCGQLKIGLEAVAYVGDDINDLPVLGAVGCPLTVSDAIALNQAAAIYITQKSGGRGAVREVCDLLLESQS